MGRAVCVRLPLNPGGISFPVPGVGTVQAVQRLELAAYSPCASAHSFLMTLQPVMIGLSMPLCILGCVTSITNVFTSNFPYIDPKALAQIPARCLCLTSYTPFAFCGLVRGILNGVLAVLNCALGLIADVIKMDAQAAALLADPATSYAGQCMSEQSAALRQNVLGQLSSIKAFLDSTGFIFQFVGAPVTSITEVSGGSTVEILTVLNECRVTLNIAAVEVNRICPY